MIILPRPYPDEVIGSVLARGARRLGLSWARLLQLAAGRAPSSVPFLMPFALDRLARCTGTDPEYLLERHTLFPYAVAFMSLDRRNAFKDRALRDGNDCGLDTLARVVLGSTPYRRVCSMCMKEDLRVRGETYWRRSHLLPGVHVCLTHQIKLRETVIPLQGGRNSSDSWLPAETPLATSDWRLSMDLLESMALHSVRAMLRVPAERDWIERYYVACFALGYALRTRALSSMAVAVDIKRFYGDDFLRSMNASVDLDHKSPWPALLVRPQYQMRVGAPKHILMLTFIEHAPPVMTLAHARYEPPGPRRRDYRLSYARIETMRCRI